MLNGFTVEAQVRSGISLASIINDDLPCLINLNLINNSGKDLNDIRVLVELSPKVVDDKAIDFAAVRNGTTVKADPKDLSDLFFNSSYISTVHDATKCEIKISAFSKLGKGDLLYQTIITTFILPYDTWGGTGRLDYTQLASFVMPSSNSIKEIHHLASDELLKNGGEVLLGYQRDSQYVIDQMAALYDSIKAQNINYINPPASFQTLGQRIRIPDKCVAEREGTCIDMAVLYASVLESIRLHPIIAVINGHAFAGCFLGEKDHFLECVETNYSNVVSMIQSQTLVMVECTFLNANSHASFKEATEQGFFDTLDFNGFFKALDINLCRVQLEKVPLPIEMDTKTGGLILVKPQKANEEETIKIDPRKRLFISPTERKKSSFEMWEYDLLDLTMRNRLLNLKVGSGFLPLVSTDSDLVAKALEHGGHLSIAALVTKAHDAQDTYDYTDNSLSGPFKEGLNRNVLYSLGSPSSLNSSLKGLYRKYRTYIEETGSNALYLALGTLRYYKEQDPRHIDPKVAPIVLIPVDIVRVHTGQSQFYIKARDEDWIINNTLVEFLKSDSKTDLSMLNNAQRDEDGNLLLPPIMNTVNAIAGKKEGWICNPDYVGLGKFDFSRYVMWNDIRLRRPELEKNKIVSSLEHGIKEWRDESVDDKDKLTDYCIPLPADSSQLDAIRAASQEKSFVLQGPPGTGKSQTIVNMITSSLFKGRTVLFVSEKAAALDVVYDRLNKLGLGQFCLQLYSAKGADKAKFLEKLKQSLDNAQQQEPQTYGNMVQKVEEERNKLSTRITAFGEAKPCYLSTDEALRRYTENQLFKGLMSFTDEYLKDLNETKVSTAKELLGDLGFLEDRLGSYVKSPLRTMKNENYSAAQEVTIKDGLNSIKNKASSLLDSLSKIKEVTGLDLDSDGDWNSLSFEIKFLNLISNSLNLPILKKQLTTNDFQTGTSLVSSMLVDMDQYQNPQAMSLRNRFSSTILDDPNLGKAFAEVKVTSAKNGIFCKIKAKFKAHKYLKVFTAPNNKVKVGESVRLLDSLYELKTVRDKVQALIPQAKKSFGDSIKDADTTVESLKDIYLYNESLAQLISTAEGNVDLLYKAFSYDTKINSSNSYLVADLYAKFKDLADYLGQAKETIGYDYRELPPNGFLKNLITNADEVVTNTDGLHEWSSFNKTLDKCVAEGLAPALKAWKSNKVATKDLASAYDCNINLGMGLINIKAHGLEGFSGLDEEKVIIQYRKDIKDFRRLSIDQLKAQLSSKVPVASDDVKPTGEMGFLKHTIIGNGRGKSIRDIMGQCSNLIRALCPCFLMSPIAAATFLSLDLSPFDIVVFDEASQIPTAEAIGPISRGHSLIVCGDPKQLPPTSFFKTKDDDEEITDATPLPSILDECRAISFPERLLNWHYRSRSESLIAFSNKEFYKNSLFTFPSIDDQKSMVEFVKVDGVYDNSKNEAEADAIVDEVIKRLKDPILCKTSMGVVAFSQSQSDLIQDRLDSRLDQDPELRNRATNVPEYLFVKNLENVQGDERDVILFSICYGPDSKGNFSHSFGPLNQKGGDQRLNVAITRARTKMIVFSIIDPETLDPDKESNIMVQYLFRFLRYAKFGRLALSEGENAIAKKRLSISQAIAERLKERGLEVVTDIGDSRFRIDLAILRPDDSGEYALGIIVEGENGNDFPIDDRFDIQPSVLARLGWKMMRVYAYDWINSPSSVTNDIMKTFEDKEDKKVPMHYANESVAVDPKDKTEIANMPTPVTATSPKAPRCNQPKAQPYKREDFQPKSYMPQHPSDFQTGNILRFLDTLIVDEGPISENRLLAETKKFFNISRLGPRMKETYGNALSHCQRITTNSDGVKFYWNDTDPLTIAHYRIYLGERRAVNDIPKEEMALAIYDILLDNYAATTDELAQKLIELFGGVKTDSNLLLAKGCVSWAIDNRTDLYAIGDGGKVMINERR